MRCLRCLTLVLTSLAVTYIPVLFDFFLSSDTSICSTMAFAPLGNSDHVVVSVSIDFLPNSKRNALFHCIAYYYSYADWDSLHDHLRDVPWEDIFKFSASVAASEFCKWFRLELMYIFFIVHISSSLTHLHGFQRLVMLPLFIEILFFISTNRINLLNLK